jgi:hypothetical protein
MPPFEVNDAEAAVAKENKGTLIIPGPDILPLLIRTPMGHCFPQAPEDLDLRNIRTILS